MKGEAEWGSGMEGLHLVVFQHFAKCKSMWHLQKFSHCYQSHCVHPLIIVPKNAGPLLLRKEEREYLSF